MRQVQSQALKLLRGLRARFRWSSSLVLERPGHHRGVISPPDHLSARSTKPLFSFALAFFNCSTRLQFPIRPRIGNRTHLNPPANHPPLPLLSRQRPSATRLLKIAGPGSTHSLRVFRGGASPSSDWEGSARTSKSACDWSWGSSSSGLNLGELTSDPSWVL